MTGLDTIFAPYVARWSLVADGAAIATNSSRLLPVRRHGHPAMLKVAVHSEEKAGNRSMVWWNGTGAARVFAYDDDALLLERATGTGRLAAMARDGNDDNASRILCETVAALHACDNPARPDLVPLSRWFADLEPAAAEHGGIIGHAHSVARVLLLAQQEIVPLHGDIHHGNVLDFAERGWRAIDPKGLIGDRCFDYANIFCNPDHDLATAPGRLAAPVGVGAQAARLDPARLLRWILAWAGLSATWSLADGQTAQTPLDVAALAARELAS